MAYEEARRKKGLEVRNIVHNKISSPQILTEKKFRSNLGQTIRIVPGNKHFHSLTIFSLDPAAQCPSIPSFPSFKPRLDKLTINKFPVAGGNQEPVESCIGIWTVSRHTHNELEFEFDDIGPIFISQSNWGTRLFPQECMEYFTRLRNWDIWLRRKKLTKPRSSILA